MARTKLAVLKEHTAELVLGIIAIGSGLGVSAWGTKESATGLAVAAVGIQIAAAIYLLKYEIFTRLAELLDERLELYDAITRIATLDQRSDSRLMERANQAIESCRKTLAELMSGRIRDSADTIFHMISEEIEEATSTIRAVHVGYSIEHIARWNDGHMKSYYRKNVAAAKRKIKVERLFILYKDRVTGAGVGKVDESVLRVLKRQHSDGIEVHVAWDSEVKEKSYLEDMVIVDERVVEYGIDAGGFVSSEWPDREAFLSFDRRRVQEFISRFKRLRSFSAPLGEWLETNNHLVPSGFTLELSDSKVKGDREPEPHNTPPQRTAEAAAERS